MLCNTKVVWTTYNWRHNNSLVKACILNSLKVRSIYSHQGHWDTEKSSLNSYILLLASLVLDMCMICLILVWSWSVLKYSCCWCLAPSKLWFGWDNVQLVPGLICWPLFRIETLTDGTKAVKKQRAVHTYKGVTNDRFGFS